MEPKSFSASAGLVFENCHARYKAEYIDKIPDLQGSAAGLGSACHEALEYYIKGGHHLNPDFTVLSNLYAISYFVYFSDRSRYDEGLKMLRNWFDRQDWKNREVLSTEVKETFDLKFKVNGVDVTVPFTYIWDRCDKVDVGNGQYDIEVVDYKSVFQPVSPEELEHRIQPRAYGLAAQIKYPQARRIRVTYDLLRYDQVGVVFTRDDNIATWRYLQELLTRVWLADGTEESLNPECRYCVRRAGCETLNKHVMGGGILGFMDFDAAIDRRADLDAAIMGLRNQLNELDEYLLDEMEEREIVGEYKTSRTEIKAAIKTTREADTGRVAPIIGEDMMARYGNIGVTAIDKIIKEESLTDEQISALKQTIRKKPGRPYLRTKPLNALSEDA
jgi:hypothetical protein